MTTDSPKGPQEMEYHQVLVVPHLKDWWAASCRECAVTNYTQSREAAEDWKDQHEADTLRLQLQANSKLEQNLDEGAGCTCQDCGARYRVDLNISDPLWADIGMPTPGGLLCGMCIMRRLEELAAQRDGFGYLAVQDHQLPPEGRPSGSERLAPQSVDELVVRLRGLVFDLQDKNPVSRYDYDNGYRDGQIQAGNDLEALVDEFDRRAALAARSEATPNVEVVELDADDPIVKRMERSMAVEGVKTPGCDCGHDGMGYGWHASSCKWSDRSPSPSLRKEGGDSA